jgi:hypothetical protein
MFKIVSFAWTRIYILPNVFSVPNQLKGSVPACRVESNSGDSEESR